MTSLDQTTNPPPAVLDESAYERLDEGQESPGKRSSWRRRPLVLTVAALVLVGTVAGAWVGYQAWDARTEQALADARQGWSSAVALLDEQIVAGEGRLDTSEGKVADEQVRTDLTDALASARVVATLEPEGTDALVSAATDAASAGADIEISVAVVEASVERFEYDDALTAHAAATERLAASTSSAQETLAATEGQVLDNTVREALVAAIESAAAVTPVVPDESADLAPQTLAMTDRTLELSTAADNLDTARQGVVDAQSAWQVEQDRIAAEQAAQAAQAAEEARLAQEQATTRPKATAPSSNTNNSTQHQPKTTGNTKEPATSGTPSAPAPSAAVPVPAPAPAVAPESGYTTETQTGTWCDSFDTSGDEGTGDWC